MRHRCDDEGPTSRMGWVVVGAVCLMLCGCLYAVQAWARSECKGSGGTVVNTYGYRDSGFACLPPGR